MDADKKAQKAEDDRVAAEEKAKSAGQRKVEATNARYLKVRDAVRGIEVAFGEMTHFQSMLAPTDDEVSLLKGLLKDAQAAFSEASRG